MSNDIHNSMDKPFPCLLLLSDIHVGKDNIPEFIYNWQEALEVCGRYGIGKMVVGGDLFQSRSSQTLDILLAVYEGLKRAHEAGIRVVLANGNHDKVNPESVKGYCHVYETLFGTEVVGKYLSIWEPEWDFVLHVMSYFPEDGSFTEVLEELRGCAWMDGKQNYLYIHQGIRGGLARPVHAELPAQLFEPFDYTFVGHYHDRRKLEQAKVEYIGASRQHNFGEDEEKGYTLLYSDGKYEFVKNRNNTRYRVLDVAMDETGDALAKQMEQLSEQGIYKFKVRVHATEAGAKQVDKDGLLKAGASKVEIVTKEPEVLKVRSVDILEKLDTHQIRENYELFCREKQIEDVSLGLTYLSKIEPVCGN